MAKLVQAYQEQLARMQSDLVQQLSELSRQSRQGARDEIEALVQLGVPAIEHILSGSLAAGPDVAQSLIGAEPAVAAVAGD